MKYKIKSHDVKQKTLTLMCLVTTGDTNLGKVRSLRSRIRWTRMYFLYASIMMELIAAAGVEMTCGKKKFKSRN